MRQTIDQILQILKDNDSFLVLAHEHPDGDAAGATLGLAQALLDMGKKAVPYNSDGLPGNSGFLNNSDLMVTTIESPMDFDAVFVLDCGELDRVGPISEKIENHKLIVNIDHHKTNDRFGFVNLIDTKSSSTGELVFRILEQGGFTINSAVSECLFTAIYTDTMALCTDSAGPEAFRICGELAKIGVDKWRVATEYYFRQSENRLRLLARALASMKIEPNGKIAGISLTAKDMEQTGATADDVEGFIDYPRNLKGVVAAYFLREQGDLTKGSLRSGVEVDSAVIAESLGGGGHARAAGFRTTGSLEEVRALLIEKINKAFSEK